MRKYIFYLLIFAALIHGNIYSQQSKKKQIRAITENEKMKLLSVFKEYSFIEEKQSFFGDILNHEDVFFVSFFTEINLCRFCLVKDEKIIYRFPDYNASGNSILEIEAVSFKDINQDGFPDVTAIVSCMTGIGPEGAIPFKNGIIYFNDKKGIFYTDNKLNDEINLKLGNENLKTIGDIFSYIKNRKK